MREISAERIENTVAELCIKANLYLPSDLESCIKCRAQDEKSEVGRNVFDDIIENIRVARDEKIPICQDTGMAVVFIELGQEVHVAGGLLEDAVNKGVARGLYRRKAQILCGF